MGSRIVDVTNTHNDTKKTKNLGWAKRHQEKLLDSGYVYVCMYVCLYVCMYVYVCMHVCM